MHPPDARDRQHSATSLARDARRAPSARAAGPSECGTASRGGAVPPGIPAGGGSVPPSSWARLAKATAARRLVTLLVLLVLPVGSRSVLDAALADPAAGEAAWRAATRSALGLAALVAAVVLTVATLLRDLRRRRAVVAHDGRVDPRTLAVLPAGPDADAARTYWWTWLVTAESPGVFDARTGRAAAGPEGRMATAARAALREELAAPAVLLLAVPAAIALLADRSLVTTAIVPAAALAALAVVRCVPWLTVPAEPPMRRCTRCDQALAGGATRCPECGVPRTKGAVRAARPRPARRVAEGLVAAIAACWIVGVLAGGPVTRFLRTSDAVPTTALLADLRAAPRWDDAAFRALVARGPDSLAAARLAEILLQRRRAGAPVGANAWAWFEVAVRTGAVPARLEDARWRDAVELDRVVVASRPPPARATGGGLPFASPPRGLAEPRRADAADAAPRLALRFVRRIDPGDGRRVGLVVVGLRVGDGPRRTPRRPDGSLCLVAAGERPTRAEWLPPTERWERPWPAPPEYVLALPPLPAADVARAAAGEPVTLDVVRFVAPAGADDVRVAWTPFGLRLTGPVRWQHHESLTLPAVPADPSRTGTEVAAVGASD